VSDDTQSEGPVYPVAPRHEAGEGESVSVARPHVFLVCDNDSWERIGPITRRLVVGLVDEAVRVSLVCDPDCPAGTALPGLQGSYNLRKPGYLDVLRPHRRFDDLLEFAQRSQPTCIHATSLSCLETALDMRRIVAVPILVSVDMLDGPQLDLLGDVVSEDCQAAVLSAPIQDALLARLRGDSHRASYVELVRPGVHVQERQQPPFEPGAPISLLVLEPATHSAAMEALLKALAQVLQAGIDVMLFFIGSGPGETHLRKMAARLQVAEHVTFTGKFMRWPQTLGAADVVVLPQPQKQVRIYPLEAMASGTLMVAASGHCYDTIVDGKTGLEFRPDREGDLAEKLVQTLRDPQRARTLAYAAQDKIRRDHSVSQMVNRYVELYGALDKVRLARHPAGNQFEI
jgi:hypothetical protein